MVTRTANDNGDAQRTVDVHAHLFSPVLEDMAAAHDGFHAAQARERALLGPAATAVNVALAAAVMPALTQVDQRLAEMDAAGIDVQLISISPSQFHPWADVDSSRDIYAHPAATSTTSSYAIMSTSAATVQSQSQLPILRKHISFPGGATRGCFISRSSLQASVPRTPRVVFR